MWVSFGIRLHLRSFLQLSIELNFLIGAVEIPLGNTDKCAKFYQVKKVAKYLVNSKRAINIYNNGVTISLSVIFKLGFSFLSM